MKKISLRYTLFSGFVLACIFTLAFVLIFNYHAVEEQSVYTASSIIQKILPIQEFSLVEYHYTSVIGLKSSKSLGELPLPFTQKFFLATYDGTIKAGIDMNQANIEILDNKVSVILPKAKITNHNIDEQSLVVYDESKNILNPIKISDYNDALKQEKAAMEKKASENGILKQAEEKAKTLTESMLKDLNFEQVLVTIKP